jgi:uncharacterized damage-inducible protein DinB
LKLDGVAETVSRKDELIRELAEARNQLLALCRQMTEQEWSLPTDDGLWTVKDNVLHVSISEPGLVRLAKKALQGEPLRSPDFDLDYYNERQVAKYREKTVDEIIADLEAARTATLAFIESLQDRDLDREAEDKYFGRVTVEYLLRRIATHDRHHLEVIKRSISRMSR